EKESDDLEESGEVAAGAGSPCLALLFHPLARSQASSCPVLLLVANVDSLVSSVVKRGDENMLIILCWVVFSPLWLFHATVARGRFSLPAPSMPHDRDWAPFHALISTPLLVAFELLLCIRLDSSYVVNLKIVFLPLLAFEMAILIDNIRMCRALMPGDEESMSDEVIWETLPQLDVFLEGMDSNITDNISLV
ncbi:hypothetical protein Goarm_013058, partial [Gossypium armourianum]|nr:hypothetical protein [Gossypium armourianum]